MNTAAKPQPIGRPHPLAKLAAAIQPQVRKEGTLVLEKK